MNHKIPAMTLIEVLCTVAVLAIVVSIASLGYFGVQRFRAERQIYGMKAELNDLRREAMVKRKSCRMDFFEDRYALENGSETKTVVYEPGTYMRLCRTANRKDYFEFSASGRPSNSGMVEFETKNGRYLLILSPVNARIRVEEIREE